MITTAQRGLLMSAVALYGVLVFVLDLLTPIGIDVWVLNLPMVLVPVLFRSIRMAVYLSLTCTAVLVAIGPFLVALGVHPGLVGFSELHRDGARRFWLACLVTIFSIKRATQLDDALRQLRQEITRQQGLEREGAAGARCSPSRHREQRQIGRELHDGVGQELTGLGLLAQYLSDRLSAAAAERRLALRLVAGLESLHQKVRGLSRGLIPVHVESRGLAAALDDLASRETEESGISVIVECPDWVELPDHPRPPSCFTSLRKRSPMPSATDARGTSA